MTYTITNNCIGCDRCVPQCPTGAISRQGQAYWINPKLCNNCTGFYSVPQCQAVCPTNSGISRLSSIASLSKGNEYWDSWFNTYERLVTKLNNAQQPSYWEQWFNTYSHQLKKVIQANQ